MIEQSTNSKILEELHRDEEVIRTDEKHLKFTIIVLICFVVIFTGVTLYFASIIRTLEERAPKQQTANTMQPSISVPSVVSQPAVSVTPLPSPNSPNVIKNPSTKNAYINVGFGTNQSSDWTDVFGATTTADIGQYERIKEVRFEAFVNVPIANGSVSVRLYNKTDNHPVWNSEVTHEGTVETYHFISPVVSYDTGPKLYQVQMKSQINIVANLVQSRIAIVTQ